LQLALSYTTQSDLLAFVPHGWVAIIENRSDDRLIPNDTRLLRWVLSQAPVEAIVGI